VVRLEDLSIEDLRRGLQVYRQLAWPGGGGQQKDLERVAAAASLEQALECFERGDPGDDPDSRRLTLRLGNERYPFMKLVLQEHLVAEEFFFSVDTHDEVTLRPDAPDREQWESLRAFNRALKGRIEEAWDQAGLPTHHDLLALLDDLARREREGAKRKTLLLVDDEVMVCRGLAALLRARGYEVELVHDGRAALERLDGDPLPDLVLLDYDMPNLDGRQVVDHLRSKDRTRRLPVLMATASAVDLGQLQTVSGVLHKPYPRQVLFELISRLLADPGRS
jgi:CheY-like chemotaxis protein